MDEEISMRNNITVHRVVKNIKHQGQFIEPHKHSFYHYIYSLRGHTTVRAEDQVFETEPDSLVLLPPGITHEIVSHDTSCCIDVKFSCSDNLSSRISALPMFIRKADQRESGLIKSIFEEAAGQEADYDEMINIRLYELLIILLRAENSSTSSYLSSAVNFASDNCPDKSIQNVLKIIEAGLSGPVRVSDLARQCGYSENYFRQVFNEYVGTCPNAYINQRKISKAREMMLYSEMNITQISEALGFQSIHYFSRLFKKTVGISPTEYISRVKDNRPINVLRNANTPEGEFEIPLRNCPG